MGEQVGDLVITMFERGAEVALDGMAQEADVLMEEGVIEVVPVAQGAFDFR